MPRMGTLAGAAGGAAATATASSTASAPARPNPGFQLGAGSFKVEFGTSCALRSDTVPPGFSNARRRKKLRGLLPDGCGDGYTAFVSYPTCGPWMHGPHDRGSMRPERVIAAVVAHILYGAALAVPVPALLDILRRSALG